MAFKQQRSNTQNFLTQTDANLTKILQAASTLDLTKEQLAVLCQELSRGQLTKLAFLKIILAQRSLILQHIISHQTEHHPSPYSTRQRTEKP